MKVILTNKVKTLGNVGEIVNVSAGYARNFLFPKKLAVVADTSNTKMLEHQQRTLAKKVDAEKKVAMDLKKKIDGTTIEFIKKVGLNGKLFGTVTSNEIATELEKQGVSVERRQITIEDQIKGVGTYNVKAKIFAGVEAEFKIKVVQDAKQAEEMKAQLAEMKKAKEAKAKMDADKAAAAEAEVAAAAAAAAEEEEASAKPAKKAPAKAKAEEEKAPAKKPAAKGKKA